MLGAELLCAQQIFYIGPVKIFLKTYHESCYPEAGFADIIQRSPASPLLANSRFPTRAGQ